ncbi:MAG: DNA (cytosine-5-)-methyltransferase, partial [Planctomycetota bacterium]
CIVNLSKGGRTRRIELRRDVVVPDDLFSRERMNVEYSTIKALSDNEVIVGYSESDKRIIDKFHSARKLGSLREYIGNLRGEIDLTKYKAQIKNEGEYVLIRGNSIGFFTDISLLIDQEKIDYIDNSAFKRDSYDEQDKLSHYKCMRIACQQISNLKTRKRLKFSLILDDIYLGNSCNYIILKNDEELGDRFGINYISLLCLLNSSIYNWRFKLTSTNNHISNNELDDLTIPLLEDKKWIYINLENIYMKFKNGYLDLEGLEIYIDAHVLLLFGLDDFEIEYLLKSEEKTETYIEQVIGLVKALGTAYVHNHEIGGLSELDKEMIRWVPPGGNWKNIPESVPSKRLEQIRRSGGRTTLYGRLRREMPSYTISTYFNRPGNGTFIHPDYFESANEGYTQSRLISFREAARLQSFKDSFVFSGSRTAMLKQIGNAVPPLLAYHIAKSIISYYKMGQVRVVDLFCGAGGLSHGFREAGCEIFLGLDNFEHALVTYKKNTPESEAISGDIMCESVKRSLYDKVENVNIDIVIGGPPCQGYSHAGWRIIDDPRNFLFKEFLTIVKEKKPLVFMMENVQGMMTINSGKTYASIIECFKEIGYNVMGKVLNAAEFGVPQRRKRVFIIGSTREINDDVFPRPLFEVNKSDKNEKKQLKLFSNKLPDAVSVEEAISDLNFIIGGRGAVKLHTAFPFGLTEYQAFMKDLIDFDTFYSERQKRLSVMGKLL